MLFYIKPNGFIFDKENTNIKNTYAGPDLGNKM